MLLFSLSEFFELPIITILVLLITLFLWVVFFLISPAIYYSSVSAKEKVNIKAAVNNDEITHKKITIGYVILFLAVIFTIISSVLLYPTKENIDIKNVNFDAWAKSWDVKIIAPDENFDNANIESVTWKLSKEHIDTAKYYLEPDGGKNVKFLHISQQKQGEQAYLTGWIEYKNTKNDFEFFMSPNGKSFMGKVHKRKTREPIEFWFATKK